MNVTTEQIGTISIVRVGETRLMYPILSDFASAVSALMAAGRHEILIDMSPVTYVDSATIGCLMDLYRQVHNAGGHLNRCSVLHAQVGAPERLRWLLRRIDLGYLGDQCRLRADRLAMPVQRRCGVPPPLGQPVLDGAEPFAQTTNRQRRHDSTFI